MAVPSGVKVGGASLPAEQHAVGGKDKDAGCGSVAQVYDAVDTGLTSKRSRVC
jgi:hypothetical protein